MVKMSKNSSKTGRQSIWTVTAFMALLAAMITGVLRSYGAVANRQALLDSGLSDSLLTYLTVYGLVQSLVSLAGLVGLRCRPTLSFVLPWAAVVLNIAGYWLERMLLWSVDQRSGNIFFMIGWHSLWLALMILFTIKPRIKETHGTRD